MSNDDEKENLQALNYDYVSDEENGDGTNQGKWVVRRPVWRSARASALMERLQCRINNCQQEHLRPRVPRVQGPPSERHVPRHHVDWAVLTDPVRETAEQRSSVEEGEEGGHHTRTPEQRSHIPLREDSNRAKRPRHRREERETPRGERRHRILDSDTE